MIAPALLGMLFVVGLLCHALFATTYNALVIWPFFFSAGVMNDFILNLGQPDAIGRDPAWPALGWALAVLVPGGIWAGFALGCAVLASATAFGTWAMLENEHFEQGVRIQTERGHRVVATGPDRFVRQPGYLGAIAGALVTPLMLGSAWTFVSAGLVAALLVLRTLLEDRMLRRELAVYAEYAQRTRFRLVPGVW